MKHVFLVQLHQALQRKEKAYFYLDTHAGRGGYDLTRAATGDTLARQPEWPDGIGRLWKQADPPAAIADYLQLVAAFDAQAQGRTDSAGGARQPPRFYPGSPWLARLLRRTQDRLALCEQHPEECAALREAFSGLRGVAVEEMNGYGAIRALLPPRERRALVLIDPPFEAQDEFAQVAAALEEGLARLPSAVYAVWYPLTQRARADQFLQAIVALEPPPTLTAELTIAGEQAPMKLKGCGLLVINPPWGFAAEVAPLAEHLAGVLAQAPGGAARLEWLVPEH